MSTPLQQFNTPQMGAVPFKPGHQGGLKKVRPPAPGCSGTLALTAVVLAMLACLAGLARGSAQVRSGPREQSACE